MSQLMQEYMIDEIERLRKLERFVKEIISQEEDDVCWRDWRGNYEELASLVGMEFKPRLLKKTKFMRNCDHFYDCLASGDHYVTSEWINKKPIQEGMYLRSNPPANNILRRDVWKISNKLYTVSGDGFGVELDSVSDRFWWYGPIPEPSWKSEQTKP